MSIPVMTVSMKFRSMMRFVSKEFWTMMPVTKVGERKISVVKSHANGRMGGMTVVSMRTACSCEHDKRTGKHNDE